MDKPRLLQRTGIVQKEANASTGEVKGSVEKLVSSCVAELMNAAVSFHKLHLKVNGSGAYAAHKALNDLYDALPGHADDLAEGYQGASEILLSYDDSAPKTLKTAAEAVEYIRELIKKVEILQGKLSYSEIVNELDNVKSTLNSAKYKLIFLK